MQINVGRGPTEKDEGPSGSAPPTPPRKGPLHPGGGVKIPMRAAGGFFRPRAPSAREPEPWRQHLQHRRPGPDPGP
jgi:hypothetical protein